MIGAILRIRYELLQHLDEGPIFHTYRARDRVQDREVCVRTLIPPYSHEIKFVEKLREVSRKLSFVQDPSVERIFELDDHEDTPFLVSELGPEQTLADRLKKLVSLSAPVAVNIAIGVLKGLEKLHAEGIVHGDIGARSVCVGADGSVQVQMGGIWETYSCSKTAGAVMIPTMAPYLAPEVAAGSMPSPASDIYAVGVLLYEMLSGRQPFQGDTAVAIAMKHASAPAPSLRAINPSIPSILEEIVKKSMSKRPDDRYYSATEMLSDLRTLRDALRFGKTLTWPLQRRSLEDAPLQPVAPKMSAVKMESKSRPEPTARQEPRARPSKAERAMEPSGDVPKWLMWFAYLALGAIVVLVGAWVFFNLNKPKLIDVPKLIGLPASEASTILGDMGLKMKIVRRESNEKFEDDRVIDMSPAPGQSVREHGTVSVVLSMGSKFVEVPDLRGRSLEDAKSIAVLKGLSIHEDVREIRSRDVPEGNIIGQIPEPRRKVERATQIRVTVAGRGEETGLGSGDNLLSTYRLKIKMPEADMSVLVRVDMTDARGTKTVYEQRHEPNESFEVVADGYGDAATFRVFFDGEIVKQVTKNANDTEQGAGANE